MKIKKKAGEMKEVKEGGANEKLAIDDWQLKRDLLNQLTERIRWR